jgi:long-chain fatty acid transport protein
MSVLTVDVDKLTLGVGLSLTVGDWSFDAVYAHVLGADVEVAPEEARSPLLQPVEAQGEPHYVNGGDYSAWANVVGLGARWSYE